MKRTQDWRLHTGGRVPFAPHYTPLMGNRYGYKHVCKHNHNILFDDSTVTEIKEKEQKKKKEQQQTCNSCCLVLLLVDRIWYRLLSTHKVDITYTYTLTVYSGSRIDSVADDSVKQTHPQPEQCISSTISAECTSLTYILCVPVCVCVLSAFRELHMQCRLTDYIHSVYTSSVCNVMLSMLMSLFFLSFSLFLSLFSFMARKCAMRLHFLVFYGSRLFCFSW